MPPTLFVRVKDRGTHHEFDVPDSDPRIGEAYDLLESDRWPPGHVIRPPKYHVTLAGLPVARPEAPRPAASRKATQKES